MSIYRIGVQRLNKMDITYVEGGTWVILLPFVQDIGREWHTRFE